MARTTPKRVFDESRRGYVKYSQALRLIAECCKVWVIKNESIRSLNLAEQMNRIAISRQIDAGIRSPLAPSEVGNCIFQPPRRVDFQAIAELKESAVWYCRAIHVEQSLEI